MYPGAQHPGFSPGGPMPAATQAFPMPPMAQGGSQLQSQIETALSLPRPDPAALWLAQQDAAKRGQRKNTGVIIAVVALTALCIIGIGALVYFKMRAVPAPPAPSAVPTVSASRRRGRRRPPPRPPPRRPLPH
jgi:serine/threonine-protein kinase